MEAVGIVLSGFELKRRRGDPIHAPGRFTVSTLSLKKRMDLRLVEEEEDFLPVQEEDLLVEQEKQGRNCKSSRCMNRVPTAPFEPKLGQNESDGIREAF